MPFTVSHIAAVVPIRKYTPLPFAALAVGSMSPDLPYYLPGSVWVAEWTHELWAVPTVDLLLGLSLWLWWRTVAPGLHFLAPIWVRSRWNLPRWRDQPWWAVVSAVVTGALTHIGWDSFTHPDGLAVDHLTFLSQSYLTPLGSFPGFSFAQHVSTLVGIAVLAWVGLHRTSQSPSVQDSKNISTMQRTLMWLVFLLIGLAAVAGAVARVLWDDPTDLRGLMFPALTGAATASAITATLIAWATSATRNRRPL